ncbi:MAG: (Fe-S)-cluster assembly protein [Candidatus Kapaibacterium sp.]|nr:MAG: (Fe-S)-cluster assembly protein [Candidatus Kapabacteria bacterium]
MRRLRAWFDTNRRDLPWRREPRDPYHVLVAEVMLQQTQVWRVEPVFERFVAQFPTLEALARAPQAAVIIAWQGLGYNRRAVNLLRCATLIVERYGGFMPDDPQTLRTLPGIGDYTASAVCAFAFGKDIAVVDVNVHRVLSRVWVPQATEADLLPRQQVQALARSLLPRGGGRWWNEALMDLGSLLCRRRQPRCTDCPLRVRCASAGTMAPPPQQRRTEPTYRGIPRRLWRGRLIAILRQQSPRLVADCADALFATPTAGDQRWLHALLRQLARDGLVVVTGETVALPGTEFAVGTYRQ